MKSRIVALTGEQSPKGGTKVEPRDITALSEDEIRTHAPLLVREIERKAVEPVETKIGEQTTAIAAMQPDVDVVARVKELLKLSEGENIVDRVTALLEQVEESAKGEIRDFVKSLIEKKVKTPRGQAVIGRLIGEMHSQYEGPLTDDMKTKIESDFDAKIDGDEDVKALIGEMGVFQEQQGKGSSQGGSHLGGRSRAGAARTEGTGNGEVSRNDNLVVKKIKVG